MFVEYLAHRKDLHGIREISDADVWHYSFHSFLAFSKVPPLSSGTILAVILIKKNGKASVLVGLSFVRPNNEREDFAVLCFFHEERGLAIF